MCSHSISFHFIPFHSIMFKSANGESVSGSEHWPYSPQSPSPLWGWNKKAAHSTHNQRGKLLVGVMVKGCNTIPIGGSRKKNTPDHGTSIGWYIQNIPIYLLATIPKKQPTMVENGEKYWKIMMANIPIPLHLTGPGFLHWSSGSPSPVNQHVVVAADAAPCAAPDTAHMANLRNCQTV